MPRKFFKRYMPEPKTMREHPRLRFLGNLLQDPGIWRLNRNSLAGGMALGVFLAFVPMPFQMIPAAIGAILLRVNLPLAVASVWISNPVTMPGMMYFCYRIGNWVMGSPLRERQFEPRLEWFWTELNTIWQPLFLGSFICGVIASLAAYGLVQFIWRLHIRNHLRLRRSRRRRADAHGTDDIR